MVTHITVTQQQPARVCKFMSFGSSSSIGLSYVTKDQLATFCNALHGISIAVLDTLIEIEVLTSTVTGRSSLYTCILNVLCQCCERACAVQIWVSCCPGPVLLKKQGNYFPRSSCNHDLQTNVWVKLNCHCNICPLLHM